MSSSGTTRNRQQAMARATNLVAFATLALALLFIFGKPLFTGADFFPPADGAPFLTHDRQLAALESTWGQWQDNALGRGRGGGGLFPMRLFTILLPPLMSHLLRYLLDTLLLGAATAFLLHGRGFRGISQWLPSVGMALSGYTFTLVSAGHAGFFDMMPFAVFMFGCADRGFRSRSVYWFAWAGVCAAFGIARQPDVLALFALLALAYCVFLFFENKPQPGALAAWKSYLGNLLLGATVSAVFFAAVVTSALAFTSRALETREEVRGRTEAEKWEFATNWSMPPEELLDMAAPFVYGIETGDPDGPYWGRLGRSLNWRETRQGLMNLKQHSLYMGLIPLIFGFYAFVGSFFEKKRNRKQPQRDAAYQEKRTGGRREIWFWSGAFAITVILAMGRFTPVYRLFYGLPFFSRIRAPVKFIHLSELALAVLFAYGLALLLWQVKTAATEKTSPSSAAGTPAVPGRSLLFGFAVGCGVLGALFGLTAIILPGLESLRAYWQDIGFGDHAGTLARVMRGGLLRATLLSFATAGVFALPLFRFRHSAMLIVVVLWGAVTVDMATVGRRYVRTGDVNPWYNRNPVADRIMADPEPGRLSFHLGHTVRRNWIFGNLLHHGVDILQPAIGDLGMPEIYRRFFGALQNNPLRLWKITNTRYILGSREQFQELIGHPAFDEVMSFDLRGGRYISIDFNGPFVLLEFKAAMPRASVFLDWETAEPDAALQRLADPEFPARHRALVSGDIEMPTEAPEAAAGRARVIRYSRTRIDIEADAPAPALLVLKDKYDPDWRITVNGRPAEALRCNYMMRGVQIPAGKSTIRMTYRPNLPYFLTSLAGILVMLGWWGKRRFMKKRIISSPEIDTRIQ